MKSLNSLGQPCVKSSIVVTAFLTLIYSYFSSLFLAGSPCHGKPPLMKYIRTMPIYSKSSLRACSIPKWVFKLAYLAVPVNYLLSL